MSHQASTPVAAPRRQAGQGRANDVVLLVIALALGATTLVAARQTHEMPDALTAAAAAMPGTGSAYVGMPAPAVDAEAAPEELPATF
jgi:hypothetical protein